MSLFLLGISALALYTAIAKILFDAEKLYLQQFSLPLCSIRSIFLSYGMGFIGLFITAWLTRERFPAHHILFFAMAASSLVGVYRIDSATMIIPDRIHVIGFTAGIGHLISLILSGEEIQSIAVNMGIGIGLVGILWFLGFVYFRLRGVVGLGFGDIKLLGWLALFVGQRMSEVILFAVFCGLGLVAAKTIVKSFHLRKFVLPGGQDSFAFGPAIVLGVVLETFYFYL